MEDSGVNLASISANFLTECICKSEYFFKFFAAILNKLSSKSELKLGFHDVKNLKAMYDLSDPYLPFLKNFMALASARPGCLFSRSGADYKAWSGAG